MDSDLHHRQKQQNQQQKRYQPQLQQTMNSGLTRYKSAPSSHFSNLINGGMYEDEGVNAFLNPGVSSTETDQILSRFMSSGDNLSSRQNLHHIRGNGHQFMDSMKLEQMKFSSQSQKQQQIMYENHARSQQVVQTNNSVVCSSSSTMADPLMAVNPPTNLLRQSSSPAGFFEQGYSMMRSMDKFQHVNGGLPDSSFTSVSRLKNRMVSSSGSHSSSRVLSRIPENEGKSMASNNGGYVASFPSGSWDESAMLTDGFLNEFGENNRINLSENQIHQGRIHVPIGLTHQMSLPTCSNELSAIENLLQFQDNVPIRSSRAKRGCATHPRSIAERVRRTRISERMRRLQDLVPNMDKQTNTADMLDLAVDYIKELQIYVETLSDHHAKCTCPHKKTVTRV